MERLRAAERAQRAAIENLIGLGVVRSRVLVGDLGEQIAARYYGVELAPVFTPGYDLVDHHGRRVQVKTLRGRRLDRGPSSVRLGSRATLFWRSGWILFTHRPKR